MKKIIKKLFVFAVVLFAANAYAQMPQMPELSDSLVRTGVLPNGLTYYIRHNEYPKGLADFHIAQKVGAVQETEEQNGLAHFLEHMCFNGTKNFPDKKIINWLETIGVKFGANLNAHTGTDETVYDIMNVPVAKTEVVDSCLLILHDWACDLTLADEEIEKERGVIHEEWRVGHGAIAKILERSAPILYPGTQYATHNIIGSMDVVDNFPPQVLRDYYEKWYRPDLQAIIVVGDIDVDAIENKIKEIFSPITMPENPALFTYQTVGDNDAPIVISEKEKEMPFNLILVAQKFDFLPRELRNTQVQVIFDYLDFIIDHILSERLTEITLSPDAPFAGCNASIGSYLYANTKGALILEAMVNDKGSQACLNSILTELKRIRLYGFTASEYERARNEYLSTLEKQYSNFPTSKNDYFTQIYINNFIENSPITAVDYEYGQMKDLVMMLPVDAVNERVKDIITDKNLVIMSLCPDADGIVVPTVEDLKVVIANVEAGNVEAKAEENLNQPLIESLPQPGKIVSEKKCDNLGFTEITLSNGVKVNIKKTNFKEDEIKFLATSDGGASIYGVADVANAGLGASIMEMTGLAKFSYSDLQKMLSGKQVSVSADVAQYSEKVSGSSSVKDLETMMQLVYLNFTQPREDKESFENVKKMLLSQLENIERDPQFVFSDSMTYYVYGNNPRMLRQNKKTVEAIDYNRSIAIYKERFANAADFTFTIVGNFDEQELRTMLCQYIATLPSSTAREQKVNDGLDFSAGDIDKTFNYPNDRNLSMLAMVWHLDVENTLKNRILASITGQLMANGLLNSVREDEGAAYSPYSIGRLNSDSYKSVAVVQTAFALNPDKKDRSLAATINSFEQLAKDLPEVELNKMKEYMLKTYDENQMENSYWLSTIDTFAKEGLDMNTDYRNIVNNISTKDVETFVADILKSGNRVKVLMLP